MEKIIEFRNTNFAYNNTNAFVDFNMEINEGDIVTLIGTPASGKTTLLKMLCNKLPNDSVYYRGTNIKSCNIQELRQNLIVVFDLPLTSASVKGELHRFISKLGFSSLDIENNIKELDKYFNINRMLDLDPKSLSREEKTLIKILRYLIIKPSFIAIDNLTTELSHIDQKKLFDFIKKNKMTLLNVTNDLELSLFGNKLYVLENFVLILEGGTLSVLKTDTLLKRLGFKLPFAVELSIELNHYDVLNKIYTDKEKLVNVLWK